MELFWGFFGFFFFGSVKSLGKLLNAPGDSKALRQLVLQGDFFLTPLEACLLKSE